MKKFICILLSFTFLIAFPGCSREEPPVDTTQSTTTTTVPEETKELDPMQEAIDRALVSQGNNYRLKAVLEKIRSGEPVTVGFIGGSITEGYMAGTKDNFTKLVTEYLDTTYGSGSGSVTCVNAGLSGTPSMLGLIRSERDLLYAQPDLIFIEFAVNDAMSTTDKQAYESLVRKCLMQENSPAVILLYSITETGYTCQDDMALTAFYYGLPAVSVKNAITPELENGTMKWTDWSSDDVHPNASGHALYTKFITNLIKTLDEKETDPELAIPERSRAGKNWSGMQLLDSTSLNVVSYGEFQPSSAHSSFSASFSHKANTTNDGLTFTVTGNTLFLVYKTTTAATYGTAEVIVDGEVVMHLTACTPDGWNNPTTQLIFSNKESAVHEVTIRMQPGDEGKLFDLLAVGVN